MENWSREQKHRLRRLKIGYAAKKAAVSSADLKWIIMAVLLIALRVLSNAGRKNAFPTRLSLRLLHAIWPVLAFDARGDVSR